MTRRTRDMCNRRDCREIGTVITPTHRWCSEHHAERQRKGRLWSQREALMAYWWMNGIPAACAYCGGPFHDVEHFIPRALGGSDDFENLVPACSECNAAKGVRAPDPLSIVDWILGRVDVQGQS